MIFENAPGRAEQPLVIAPGDQPNCDRIAIGDIRSQIEIGAGFIIQLELRNHFGTPDIALYRRLDVVGERRFPKAQEWEETNYPYLPSRRAAVVPAIISEEHTSELQSLMRISYAVFCLKTKQLLRMIYVN